MLLKGPEETMAKLATLCEVQYDQAQLFAPNLLSTSSKSVYNDDEVCNWSLFHSKTLETDGNDSGPESIQQPRVRARTAFVMSSTGYNRGNRRCEYRLPGSAKECIGGRFNRSLVWMEALNGWIPEDRESPKFLNFIQRPQMGLKAFSSTERCREERGWESTVSASYPTPSSTTDDSTELNSPVLPVVPTLNLNHTNNVSKRKDLSPEYQKKLPHVTTVVDAPCEPHAHSAMLALPPAVDDSSMCSDFRSDPDDARHSGKIVSVSGDVTHYSPRAPHSNKNSPLIDDTKEKYPRDVLPWLRPHAKFRKSRHRESRRVTKTTTLQKSLLSTNEDRGDGPTKSSLLPADSKNAASRPLPTIADTAQVIDAVGATGTQQRELALTAKPYDDTITIPSCVTRPTKLRRPIKVRTARELKHREPPSGRLIAEIVPIEERTHSPPLTQLPQEEKEEQQQGAKKMQAVVFDLPALPTLSDNKASNASCHRSRFHIMARTMSPKKRTTTAEDEPDNLFDPHMAERRRRQLMSKINAKAVKKNHTVNDDGQHLLRFEDCDFLAKYCIFNNDTLDMYRQCFESIDEDGRGSISNDEALLGLRVMNTTLSTQDVTYMDRILELVGYDTTQGADFKLFSVMAALSTKISALDDWMKNLVCHMDMGSLEHRIFMCKTLWQCNVDPATNRIHIDQLCLDLRAGGVSPQHEADVCKKLSPLVHLDLLDFLTYIPLFLMIHASVVINPFDESREK